MEQPKAFPLGKCSSCGWLHIAVPAAWARSEVVAVSDWLERTGESRRTDYDHYLHCFNCGADSAKFLPAVESDGPLGVTLQPVVVER